MFGFRGFGVVFKGSGLKVCHLGASGLGFWVWGLEFRLMRSRFTNTKLASCGHTDAKLA